MKRKVKRERRPGEKMVPSGLRLTQAQAEYLKKKSKQAHEGNISMYMRSLIEKEMQSKTT